MTEVHNLASLLRSWRERAEPDVAGRARDRRHTPGLRREELATMAGVSIDYVVRLEQGRATRPSSQVLDALAKALRLSAGEVGVLYRSAGLSAPPSPVDRRLPTSVERLASRLDAVAVGVYSADWWLLSWNPRWAALLGDPTSFSGPDRNLVWQVFTGEHWRAAPADRPLREFQEALVADLRIAAAEHPADERLLDLVTNLRATSAVFDEQWAAGRAAAHCSERKNIRHPCGDLVLDCDVLKVAGSDTNVLVYSAAPGSADAELFERIAAGSGA